VPHALALPARHQIGPGYQRSGPRPVLGCPQGRPDHAAGGRT